MPAPRKRAYLGIAAFVMLVGARPAFAQAIRPGENIDKVLVSGVVRTGENLKLPPSGDLRARGKESDYPRIQKITDNVYLNQAIHGTPGLVTNNLIVVTSAGVVLLDGPGDVKKMAQEVEAIKQLTPQPIRYVIIGAGHGDHHGGGFDLPGVTVVGHAIMKDWFDRDRRLPPCAAGMRGTGCRQPNAAKLPNITEVVGELPVNPLKAPPRATKVLKVGDTEFQIMYLGRSHSGPDLVTYLPKQRILWLSESFRSREFPSQGLTGYPSEWVALLKEVAQMKNVDNYLGAHGYMDSPEVNKEELLNYTRMQMANNAEAKRLFLAGIPVEETPKHWHFGEFALWFLNDHALANMYANYLELMDLLPSCPPCMPRRGNNEGPAATP